MGTKTKEKEAYEAPAVNWASINTEIKFRGKEITLPADPANMDYDDAIATIERVKQQEAQQFDVGELIKGAPWDGLVAIYKACQEIYGVVTSHSIKTWFGDIKPQFVTVNTGPGSTDKVQVPSGQMRVPGVKTPFMVGLIPEGAYISGTVNRRDQTRLIEIANVARRIIRQDSIYKTKAIRLSVDEDGDLQLEQQPEFLDLSHVRESDMIHTEETTKLIDVNILSPLKNTEGCRKHRIPLKRGILLEGRYGTGKSLTARVTAKVATDSNWTFIMLDRSKGLRAAIEFAKNYQPCVIFAEDIDRAADRDDESVNDLVNMMDGLVTKDMEMMIVLTTNFIEKIDQSLLRPGRFDAVISIQSPDAETVARLVRAYARDLLEDTVDLSRVGELALGQIPATIREIVERAKLSMLMEQRESLTEEDLYVSALGMRRHMDLLNPKEKEETFQTKLVEGLKGLLEEAAFGGEDLEAAINGTAARSRTMLKEGVSTIRKDVANVANYASSAANTSQEILEIVQDD